MKVYNISVTWGRWVLGVLLFLKYMLNILSILYYTFVNELKIYVWVIPVYIWGSSVGTSSRIKVIKCIFLDILLTNPKTYTNLTRIIKKRGRRTYEHWSFLSDVTRSYDFSVTTKTESTAKSYGYVKLFMIWGL